MDSDPPFCVHIQLDSGATYLFSFANNNWEGECLSFFQTLGPLAARDILHWIKMAYGFGKRSGTFAGGRWQAILALGLSERELTLLEMIKQEFQIEQDDEAIARCLQFVMKYSSAQHRDHLNKVLNDIEYPLPERVVGPKRS